MKIAILYIILFFISLGAFAQPFPDIKFTRLSEKDGLSSNSVTSIAQDGNGIIWASTDNGLNRFDGYGFANFYSNPYDSNSIAANDIESIHSDSKDNLWMITAAGICRFNTVTQKAQSFKAGANTPAPFKIYDGSNIWFDNNRSTPYIISNSGLFHFIDNLHFKAVDIGFPAFSYKTFLFSSYNKLVTDKNGQLWAFAHNRIFKINSVTKKVEKEFVCPNEETGIFDILFDSYNRCWVSTWGNGIYCFNPTQNSWRQFHPENLSNQVIKYGVEWTWNQKRFLVFSTGKPTLLFIDEESLKVLSRTSRNQKGKLVICFDYGTTYTTILRKDKRRNQLL